ncbi:hypothetical protein F4141_23660 [Candidatus Poribacteria bacterium]|nr:hypothetical protein [Candidatus Poribacteria bacterium]MYA72621.1 hypothetical protein [Candidatus Poribacteria bacterium]MYH83690.1 hypothetical protein [Candidatus Poribacteria bacterium]
MKTHMFWLVRLLVMVCIFAVGSVPMVYADAHEMGEEMAEEEASGASGWFRTDTDSLGTQIWVGASHSPSFLGSLSLDTDIYVVDTFGELDIGLGIPVVDSDSLSLSFLPMVGIGFDYAAANGPSSLIAPQLFTYLTAGSIYFESWIQGFFNSMFDEEAGDSFYTRNFVLLSLNDTLSVGPQVEVTLDLGDDGGLGSMVVGGRANVGYGENNTLGVFVGFETQKGDDETGLTGRMTFVRTW